jgi:hypothetical protein
VASTDHAATGVLLFAHRKIPSKHTDSYTSTVIIASVKLEYAVFVRVTVFLLSLPLGPGVYSASNRNEYQELNK